MKEFRAKRGFPNWANTSKGLYEKYWYVGLLKEYLRKVRTFWKYEVVLVQH